MRARAGWWRLGAMRLDEAAARRGEDFWPVIWHLSPFLRPCSASIAGGCGTFDAGLPTYQLVGFRSAVTVARRGTEKIMERWFMIFE